MPHKKNVDKFGATRLARESEKGDLAAVEAAYSAAPEELNQADFAGIAPLQKAALNGYANVVRFLIEKGCRTDCESNDRDTPLIDAVENGHLDVVKLLLDKGKVNPHHQNKKGQRAIDVLDFDYEDSEEIEKELKAAMRKAVDTNFNETHDGPNLDGQKSASRLLYNEYNTETLVEKAADGDIIAVGELLNSNIKPNIACGVAAARGGHYDILSILLAHGLKADPDPSKHSETPMLVAIGRGHLKIVDLLLEQDNFNPTRRDRNGKTYYELSDERRGPKWEHERDILKRAFDAWQQSHKSPKRNRKEAPNPSQVRTKRKSSPMREQSSSPRPEAKRSQARSSSGTQPAQKSRGRLMSGREMANQRENAKRRRRVVDEESSSGGSDDEVRAPVKRKPRSFSDSGEHKPKKRLDKVRSGDLDAPKKAERAHSDHNDDDRQRRMGKSGEKKIYNNKPPPEAESLDERKLTRKMSTKVRPAEERPRKRPLEDMSSDEIKARKTSTTSAMSTPAPPEKASTPDSVRERRQEAEKHAAEAKRKAEAEARKREEEEAARKAAEEEQAREREREQARMKAEAEAEAKRIAEEKERARLAAEEEANRIREEEAAKQAARRERISKLPLALRLACERGKNRHLHFKGETLGISFVFLPIYYAEASDVDPDRPAHLPREPYVMSFQAVGILGLPEPDLALADAPYCDWPRKPVTQPQRENLIGKYDIARLAQDERFPLPGMTGYDGPKIQARIKEARKQLMDMEGLYWIPLHLLRDAVRDDPFLKPLESRIVDGDSGCRIVGRKRKSGATFMDFLRVKNADETVQRNGQKETSVEKEQDKDKMDVDVTENSSKEG
jgi:ankyrin repeat protein